MRFRWFQALLIQKSSYPPARPWVNTRISSSIAFCGRGMCVQKCSTWVQYCSSRTSSRKNGNGWIPCKAQGCLGTHSDVPMYKPVGETPVPRVHIPLSSTHFVTWYPQSNNHNHRQIVVWKAPSGPRWLSLSVSLDIWFPPSKHIFYRKLQGYKGLNLSQHAGRHCNGNKLLPLGGHIQTIAVEESWNWESGCGHTWTTRVWWLASTWHVLWRIKMTWVVACIVTASTGRSW